MYFQISEELIHTGGAVLRINLRRKWARASTNCQPMKMVSLTVAVFNMKTRNKSTENEMAYTSVLNGTFRFLNQLPIYGDMRSLDGRNPTCSLREKQLLEKHAHKTPATLKKPKNFTRRLWNAKKDMSVCSKNPHIARFGKRIRQRQSKPKYSSKTRFKTKKQKFFESPNESQEISLEKNQIDWPCFLAY